MCRALFATHYHELTELADRLDFGANASLRAKEWRGELVFLHEVGPGPADKSYGVEVARRAGLPKSAVARAKDVLARLESERVGADALTNLPLFASLPQADDAPSDEPDVLHAAMADVDPDTMTPREALDVLYRLKTLVEPT